jgi:hypothetical protein
MGTIISNTDMDSDKKNNENEFGYIHFSIHISNRMRILIVTFTF